MRAVLAVALGAICAEAFAPLPGAVSLAKFSLPPRRARAQGVGVRMEEEGTQSRRGMLLKAAAAGAAGLAVQLCPVAVAAAEAEPTPEPKFKFRRVPRIQFIAALGDPAASSGTGADKWGLWEEDPGPRGVRLGSYQKLKSKGKAPAGWEFDKSDWWLEEHGLIMETPGKLPAKKFVRDGKFTLDRAKYVVTGDREVTTVLTVYSDGRWKLDKGTLYDVTHLPCRSARYTPDEGGSSCTPEQARNADFPVTPGAAMPAVAGCNKQDYAVLFVLGIEGPV